MLLRIAAQIGQGVARVTAADHREVLRVFPGRYVAVASALRQSPARRLRELASSLGCLFRMLTDRDFPLSWGTTAAIVFALAYFISPLDLIPDAAAVVGYLDDALLIAEISVLVGDDIGRYRALQAARQASGGEDDVVGVKGDDAAILELVDHPAEAGQIEGQAEVARHAA
jgi:uncharacterized membrane protein YkvA (DUF1232 family)